MSDVRRDRRAKAGKVEKTEERDRSRRMPGLNVTEQDMGKSKTWETASCSVVTASFSAAFHPSHDAYKIPCKYGYIGYISVMLV